MPESAVTSTRLRITMVGHSTVLLEIGGARILTDPYLGSSGTLAYRRLRPPGLGRRELTTLDSVLLSHNHWDHTDRRFFRQLDRSVPVLTRRGSAWVTRLKGARNVVGMRPWEERAVSGITVTAVPAVHTAPSIGFVLRAAERTLYFAGDTYYRPFMHEIGRRFAPHVALLPVATYRIPMTMGERGAVRAVTQLGASIIIPIHGGIEPRSPLLRTGQSPESFARRAVEAGMDARVVVLAEGDVWTSQ